MLDNLKFDRNFIKECVLYDILNWKTLETSYEDICKLIGENAITESDHQVLFNEFVEETRNSYSTRKIIEKVFKKKPLSLFIKYRIQQDVISKLPIKHSYDNQCEMIGVVDYPEFDYWYYRFYNGDNDLDYDRSKDPKPLTFSALPTDVIKKIVEDWSFRHQYKLRRVSRDLRNLIDDTKPPIKRFELDFDGWYSPFMCSFWDSRTDRQYYCNNSMEKTRIMLAALVKNPKFCLDSLSIRMCEHQSLDKQIRDMLTSLPRQLPVKHISIAGCNEPNAQYMITSCVPGVLKIIHLSCNNDDAFWEIPREILNSEQWKQAESVWIRCSISCDLHHFYHFNSFYIRRSSVSMNDLLTREWSKWGSIYLSNVEIEHNRMLVEL